MPSNDDFLVKVGPVADIARVPDGTVYRWIREHKLAAIKMGRTVRVRASEVERVFGVRPPRPESRRLVS
jgi:excisionase family DNA binding protein